MVLNIYRDEIEVNIHHYIWQGSFEVDASVEIGSLLVGILPYGISRVLLLS